LSFGKSSVIYFREQNESFPVQDMRGGGGEGGKRGTGARENGGGRAEGEGGGSGSEKNAGAILKG